MHTQVVGRYILHPLLPGVQATHGTQQGGCSVTDRGCEVEGQLSNQVLTAPSLPLLFLLFVKNILASSKLCFHTGSSLSQKPFTNSLVTVKQVVMFFFNKSGLGANALSDKFQVFNSHICLQSHSYFISCCYPGHLTKMKVCAGTLM